MDREFSNKLPVDREHSQNFDERSDSEQSNEQMFFQ